MLPLSLQRQHHEEPHVLLCSHTDGCADACGGYSMYRVLCGCGLLFVSGRGDVLH